MTVAPLVVGLVAFLGIAVAGAKLTREHNATHSRGDKTSPPPPPPPPPPRGSTGEDLPQPGYNFVAETDLALHNKPSDLDVRKQYEDHEDHLRQEFQREHQEQQKKQFQLEQAVRFQEDELQQLREQVQELRLQLSRALQLYQLTAVSAARQPVNSPAPGPPGFQAPLRPSFGGDFRRFYRNPEEDFASGFGQRIAHRTYQWK